MPTDNINAGYAVPKDLVRDVGTNSAEPKAFTQVDFLKILTTQMKIQDPTKPLDSGQMMQQMSQLTALSSSQELKSAIEGLKQNQYQSQFLSSTQLIGKEVAVISSVSQLDNSLKGSVVLANRATEVTVQIKNSAGQVVKTLSLPGSEAGVVDFTWDGKNEEGQEMPKDFYTMSASAKNNGANIDTATLGIFKVNSVTLDRKNYSTIVNLAGLGGVSMNNVIKIIS